MKKSILRLNKLLVAFLLIAAFVLLLLPARATAEDGSDGNFLYEADFDATDTLPEEWHAPAGNPSGSSVSVKDRALVIGNMGTITPAAVYCDAEIGSDYILEADVTIEQTRDNSRWAGICFRVQETDGWMKSSIGFPRNCALNVFKKTNITGGSYLEVVKADLIEDIRLNSTYRLKTVVYGNTAAFFVDGEYIADAEIPAGYETGGFGLACSGSVTKFDNITVTQATEAAPSMADKIYDNIEIPETGIVNPPVVVSVPESATFSETPGAVTVFSFLQDGTLASSDGTLLGRADDVLDEFGGTTIPAFRVTNEAEANALSAYLEETFTVDAFVLANEQQAELIRQVRENSRYVRGILEFNSAPTTEAEAKEILFTANRMDANVVLLPEGTPVDCVYYLQKHMISVWKTASDAVSVYEAITTGVNGIVCPNADIVYGCYGTFTETTVIRQPIVMAHRGASSLYPQNTLNGMILAYEMGADGIETDLYVTKDNQIVLFHDGTLDALTDGTGSIESHTLAELKELTIDEYPGICETIPSLEEVFQYFKDKDVLFMLELKSSNTQLIPLLKDLLEKYDFKDKVILMTNLTAQLRSAHELIPEVSLSRGSLGEIINILPEDTQSLATSIRELSPYRYQPFPFWYNTPDGSWEYLYKFAARGWLSWSSTCNTQEDFDMRNLTVYGATSVLTNNFQWAKDYVYRLEAQDFSVQVGEDFVPKANLIGYDGTFEDRYDFILIKGSLAFEKTENGYRFKSAGTATLLPYTNIMLSREIGNDLEYRLYGAPITVTVI